MNLQHYLVLEAISSGIPPQKIAEMLDLEPHDVEAILHLLEEKGVVKRGPGGGYFLTEEGAKALSSWRASVGSDGPLFRDEGPAAQLVKWLPVAAVVVGLGVAALALLKFLSRSD